MKKRLRLVPLLVLVVVVASSCIWPAFRYGPERTGFNSAETTLGVANVGSLNRKWTAQTGAATTSSPAVAQGVLYISTSTGELRAFDAAGSTGCSGTPKTCTPLWTAVLGGFSMSSPAVSGGVVYVGATIPVYADPFDVLDGVFYAFDATGTTGCSGTPKVCTPLWRADSDQAGASSPVVVGGRVYLGMDGLQAFDAAGSVNCTGTPTVCTPIWTGGTGGFTVSSPALAGNVAYQLTGGTLEAFNVDGTTGCSGTPTVCTPIWRATLGSFDSSPAVSGDLLYIGADDGKVRAFKTAATFPQCTGVAPKTCNPLWSVTTGGEVDASPAVADGVVYVGSRDDKLYALDAATGTVLWTATTGGDVTSSPTVANGVVYVGSDDGDIYAFDATGTTGCSGTPKVCTPLWSDSTGDAVGSSPVVVNGTLYVSSTDGTLYAYGL